MNNIIDYDADYFNKCAEYEGSDIADHLNYERKKLVERHYGHGLMVDVGIGSGEFIKSRPNTFGADVNPVALEWLRGNGKLADNDVALYGAFSFWDVIEHMPYPEVFLAPIIAGTKVFFSIPIFDDLSKIRQSKHYRPGEHLHYWTRSGFVAWLLWQGFELLEMNNNETKCGREAIESFAFVRVFK